MVRKATLIDRLVSWSPVFLLGGLAALTYWLDAQVQSKGPTERAGVGYALATDLDDDTSAKLVAAFQ